MLKPIGANKGEEMDKMLEQINQQIEEIIISTIEKMVFAEVNHCDYTDPEKIGNMIAASLALHEPVKKNFSLAMERKLAFDMAGSLFSAYEKDLNKELVNDTVLEMLNITVGAVSTALFNGNQDFELGLPKICDRFPYDTSTHIYHFTVDGLSLLFGSPDLRLFYTPNGDNENRKP